MLVPIKDIKETVLNLITKLQKENEELQAINMKCKELGWLDE